MLALGSSTLLYNIILDISNRRGFGFSSGSSGNIGVGVGINSNNILAQTMPSISVSVSNENYQYLMKLMEIRKSVGLSRIVGDMIDDYKVRTK